MVSAIVQFLAFLDMYASLPPPRCAKRMLFICESRLPLLGPALAFSVFKFVLSFVYSFLYELGVRVQFM